MRAEDLKVGDRIGEGIVTEVRSDTSPDRLVIGIRTIGSEDTYFRTVSRGEQVGPARIRLNQHKILFDIAEALSKRLEFGRQQYGEFWNGEVSLDSIEEELLDALIYLWVLRQTMKE